MSRTPGGRDASDYRGLAIAGTAVMELVAPVVIGVWADQRFGWSPWGLVAGGALGFVGGIAHLLFMMKQADRQKPGGNG